MLSKSLKHEFRATSRVMLPIFIALLLLAVAAHFSILLLNTYTLPWFLEIIGGATIALFAAALIAACVGVIVLIVIRFYRSFLSDEGYLNMTLPVNVHTHISSRLIVSVIWYTLTAIAVLLCLMVMILDSAGWKGIFMDIGDLFRQISQAGLTWNVIVLGLEMILSAVIGSALSSLMLYAALSVGHSFNRGKKGLSVLFAFVFSHAIQILSFIVIFALSRKDWSSLTATFELEPMKVIPFMEGMMGLSILGVAVLCAVFYFITHYFLTKKLNLE